MTHSTRQQRLVLVVDTDAGFAEITRGMLPDDRILTAPTVEEAAEVLVDERVDLALLGPSLGTERGVTSAGLLRDVDPCLRAVLVTNIVTNRVLLASLRSGIVDVVDTPLTETKLSGIFERLLPSVRESVPESPVEPLTGPSALVDSNPQSWSGVATPASFSESEVHTHTWQVSAVSGPVSPASDPGGAGVLRRVESLHFEVEPGEEQPESEDLPRTGGVRA